MILSRDEVLSLISIPKHTKERGIDLSRNKNSLSMHAEDNDSLTFRLHVNTSEKVQLKLSCHHDRLSCHHEHEDIGLIRVDFYGAHKNPETITTDTPDFLHKYVGKRFSAKEEHHVHVYVNGFGLDWAIPVTEHEFRIKNIKNQADMANSVLEFSRLINLRTSLLIAQSPLI